jgi:hypothetical protein
MEKKGYGRPGGYLLTARGDEVVERRWSTDDDDDDDVAMMR